MNPSLKALLVEDNPGDSRLIREYLKLEIPSLALTAVTQLSDALAAIAAGGSFDVALLDLALPDSFGLLTLEALMHASEKNTAIIVLTGTDDKQMAIESLAKGAEDYLTKGCFSAESLGKAIRYAVERRRAQRTIREQERTLHLAAKLTALGELTAFIFHEIGTPLAAISMSQQMISRALCGNADSNQLSLLASSLERNIHRMEKIMRGLKNFVRSTPQDAFEQVRVSEVIGGVVELCGKRFTTTQIEFERRLPAEDISFECREAQIAQVLVNLLNNAFDAVKNLAQKWVRLEVAEIENGIQFRVTDSGQGIPTELEEKILQTFFTTKSADGGTGLGLSISKRIVEEHGGTLELDRRLKNTSFIVNLPKRRHSGFKHETKAFNRVHSSVH